MEDSRKSCALLGPGVQCCREQGRSCIVFYDLALEVRGHRFCHSLWVREATSPLRVKIGGHRNPPLDGRRVKKSVAILKNYRNTNNSYHQLCAQPGTKILCIYFFTITLWIRYLNLHLIERLGDLPKVTQLERDISTMRWDSIPL